MSKPKRVPNPPGKCIFCGQGGLSKEHVWSEWTYDLVPRLKENNHIRQLRKSSAHDPKLVDVKIDKLHTGAVNSIKLYVVCEKHCNNGWMSRLEMAAKPILTPLILGQPAVLSETSIKTIAAWITMKMMVTEFARDADVASSQEDRNHLMMQLEPPSGWSIWIAHVRSPVWRTAYFRNSSLIGRINDDGIPVAPKGSGRKNTQSITIGVGELLFTAMSTGVPDLQLNAPIDAKRHIRQIWPITSGWLWPPGTIFNTEAANLLAVGLSRAIAQLKWTPIRVEN